MLDFEDDICIELPCGTLDDVLAYFTIEQETYEREPYPWGEGRGMETETTATLKWVKLGGLKLDTQDVLEMVGAETLKWYNEAAANKFEESQR